MTATSHRALMKERRKEGKLCSTYLLIGRILGAKITAGLLELQVEVRKAMQQVNPPRWGIIHNGGHSHLQ